MKNRVGKVEISRELVESTLGIFREINPIHIEEKEYGVMIYTCLSKHFDELETGDIIPFYDCEILDVTERKDKENKYLFKFRKR